MLRELLPLARRRGLHRQRATRARCRPATLASLGASSAARRPRSSAIPRAALERARELAGPGRRRARHRLDLPRRRPAVRAGRAGGRRRCERARPQRPRDDRARRGRRGARDPGLLRASATASAGCSCKRRRGYRCPPSTLIATMHLSASSASTTTALNPAVNVLILFLRRHLAGARLLDVRRRPAPDRRPDAGRLRHGRLAVPVRRDDRLHDRAPAGVPRRRARCASSRCRPPRRGCARSTTSCARTATTRSRTTSCAARAACGGSRSRCYSLRQAARPALEDLPVLRGRDGRRPAALRAPPAPRRHAGQPTGGTERAAETRARSRRRTRPQRRRRRRRRPERDPDQGPSMDRTLILVKPDAFARSLTGEIIARFERKGLQIVALQAHDGRRASSPSSTTPSTTASRSSASSSSSSPPARSSRWCSRATRPSRPRAR